MPRISSDSKGVKKPSEGPSRKNGNMDAGSVQTDVL